MTNKKRQEAEIEKKAEELCNLLTEYEGNKSPIVEAICIAVASTLDNFYDVLGVLEDAKLTLKCLSSDKKDEATTFYVNPQIDGESVN